VQTRKVLNDADIETVFAAMRADPPDFLMVNPSPLLFVERARSVWRPAARWWITPRPAAW